MLGELGHELWIGDAAQIRASVVRKQKTDARDAAHLLELLLSESLSARIWRPSLEERDLRQLVWHRGGWPTSRESITGPLDTMAEKNKLGAPFLVLCEKWAATQSAS